MCEREGVCVCVYVRGTESVFMSVSECVCVCMLEGERERVCVYVRGTEKERER